MGHFHYGTSSFSDKSWVGPFYPTGTRPGDFLLHYATQFGAVEVDATYYAVPKPALVDGWARKTPPEFRLCAKFPRSIVHAGEGPRPDGDKVLNPVHVGEDRDRFLDALDRLGERAGPLVLQFPYFNQQAFASSQPFFERLDAFLATLPDRFRYAVEVRNKQWIGPPLLELLRSHRAAFVWSEMTYLPHPADLAQRWDILTTDFVYARLIGDRKRTEAACEAFDHVVLDKSADLDRWAELLRPAIARARETFAFANNHYAGHGPETIRDLAQRLRLT